MTHLLVEPWWYYAVFGVCVAIVAYIAWDMRRISRVPVITVTAPVRPITRLRELTVLAEAAGRVLSSAQTGEYREMLFDHFVAVLDSSLQQGLGEKACGDAMIAATVGMKVGR